MRRKTQAFQYFYLEVGFTTFGYFYHTCSSIVCSSAPEAVRHVFPSSLFFFCCSPLHIGHNIVQEAMNSLNSPSHQGPALF